MPRDFMRALQKTLFIKISNQHWITMYINVHNIDNFSDLNITVVMIIMH